jgi:hypothetical protein
LCYIRDDGSIDVENHTFTKKELEAFAIELKAAYVRLSRDAKKQETPVNTGVWCKYCPSVISCPAQTALAKNMVGELADLAKGVYDLDDEGAAAAYAKAKNAERLLDAVLLATKTRAGMKPIPLGNGLAYGTTTSKRSSFDKSKALLLLRQLGATQQQLNDLKTTKRFDVTREYTVGDEK